MERYFLRSDKDNFWFVLISDKVESYMYKFTVTENEPIMLTGLKLTE